MKNKPIKKIILTIDYEVFFGEKEGTTDSCMIKPTDLLVDLLTKHKSKMTVFWDVLHYWKLKELAPFHPELTEDLRKIEKQITTMVIDGHDIQLHLHPHWLNTSYDNGKWHFDLTGYRLHSLSSSEEPENIHTIAGCIAIGRDLIESVCRTANTGYKVSTFRAGGYCIQPFSSLQKPLADNGILIDSSVCYGFRFDHEQHSYDFTGIPVKTRYRFRDKVESEDSQGQFIEFPIGSIKASPLHVLWWAFLHRTKYRNLRYKGETGALKAGSKIKEEYPHDHLISKVTRIFREPRYIMLTPDNFFKEKFEHIVNRAEDGSVMILHPKYLNEHTFGLLGKQLNTGQVRFCSIKEIMNDNG